MVRMGVKASLWLSGGMGNVLATPGDNTIHDGGSRTVIMVDTDVGALKIDGFQNDKTGIIQFLGGVGFYATAQQALAAIVSDGTDGSMLSLGSAG